MESKDLLPKPKKIAALTPKARVFIQLICDGLPVPDAYRKAGYDGKNNHAAYALKALLSKHLREALEARGFSMEGIATEILQLTKIPLIPREAVTLDEKIKILRLFASVMPRQERAATSPHVTAFIINRGDKGNTVVTGERDVIDTSAEGDKRV